jgi:hypothetical protein
MDNIIYQKLAEMMLLMHFNIKISETYLASSLVIKMIKLKHPHPFTAVNEIAYKHSSDSQVLRLEHEAECLAILNNVVSLNEPNDPAACSRCQNETQYVILNHGRQYHSCINCGYQFIAEPANPIDDFMEMYAGYKRMKVSDVADFNSHECEKDVTNLYSFQLKDECIELRVCGTHNEAFYEFYNGFNRIFDKFYELKPDTLNNFIVKRMGLLETT